MSAPVALPHRRLARHLRPRGRVAHHQRRAHRPSLGRLPQLASISSGGRAMERLERFYKIDQLLKERKVVPFATFKEVLGMSRASVKRDLEYMRNRFNAPIEYDRETNGYSFGRPRTGPRYELPGLWLNAGEAYALLSMHTLLAELQPGLLEPHVGPL